MPYQAGSSAQRIRIGLTGLAFAFLLVLLGSIITRSNRDNTTNAAQQAATNEPSGAPAVIPITMIGKSRSPASFE